MTPMGQRKLEKLHQSLHLAVENSNQQATWTMAHVCIVLTPSRGPITGLDDFSSWRISH